MSDTKQIFTVNEVAAVLGRSRRTVIRMFEDEPGVIVWAQSDGPDKRRYRSLSIPRAVLTRVLSRISQGGVVSVKFIRKRR